jgi:multimeric flavodoxin WrbA
MNFWGTGYYQRVKMSMAAVNVREEKTMEVVMLNGSPRGMKSVTGKFLDALASGFEAGGAVVTQFKVASMNIGPCNACLSCMHRTPGECVQKDDMAHVYPRLKTADLLVMGTPVYTDNMTSQLKAVIDRTISCLQPFLTRNDDSKIVHSHWWNMPGKYFLVSTCGFPEMSNFDPLIATFRAQAVNAGSVSVGEVCIPGSIALQMKADRMIPYLDLLTALGKKMAASGDPDRTILQQLNRSPFDVDEYLAIAAEYEAWCRKKLGIEQKEPSSS